MSPAGSSRAMEGEGAGPSPRLSGRLAAILAAVLFSAIFAALTIPSLDSEFWWHLASGRWMWENRRLMSADPFDCTSAVFGAPGQVHFLLTQYWLAQVLLYLSYLLGGFTGASLLRAAVLTALFFALHRLVRRTGAGVALSALLVALAFQALVLEMKYVENRPQIWSSLCFVALLLLLENLREGRRWAGIALPPFMLLWANLHGGYILGVVVIVLAMAAAFLARHPERRRMLIAGGIAIALSAGNPAGWEVLLKYPLARLTGAQTAGSGIFEEESLFKYFKVWTLPRSRPGLAALFLLPLVTLLPRLKSLPRERLDLLAIYLLTLGLGLKSQRFLVFMIPMACWVIALNIAVFRGWMMSSRHFAHLRRLPPWAAPALAAAVVVGLTAWYARTAALTSALRPAAGVHHPAEAAADYLARSGLKGNVFNEYTLGGYLAWRLGPEMKVFIYGRMVYPKLLELYEDVVQSPRKTVSLAPGGGLRYFYQEVFDRYAIDAVVMPGGADSISGDANALVWMLAQDDGWALVHARAETLVFLRRTGALAPLLANALPKETIFDIMISIASSVGRSGHGRASPVWRRTVALAHLGKGQPREALRLFDEYLALMPQDEFARRMRAAAAGAAGAAR